MDWNFEPGKMTDTEESVTAQAMPGNSLTAEVRRGLPICPISTTSAPLGPLAAFTGKWVGRGFNTIFRPYAKTDNQCFPPSNKGQLDDAVLELNLTAESLSFGPNLGSITNRGFETQEDIVLSGVPYLQSISDVTTSPARSIHLEPGIWLYVPATTKPMGGVTLARMGSIPHGTTINAQGTFKIGTGKPTIAAVDITPRFASNSAPVPYPGILFPSLTASNQNTFRVPQNLAPYIAAGTITQSMLTDPNTVLRNQIANQNISETVCIDISTTPAAPLFGGGVATLPFFTESLGGLTLRPCGLTQRSGLKP
jgi:hypothetical protein